MKKLTKLALAFVLTFGLVFLASNVSFAANVSTLDTTGSGGKIAVSGTTESGVVAVAVLVYDEAGTNLVAMETAAVTSGEYKYTMDHAFDAGKYVVKVADYNGGDYVTKEVTVTKEATKSPKTAGVPNLVWGLLALSAIGVMLAITNVKRDDDN